MSSDVKTLDPLRETVRVGTRDASAASWWFVALGALWVLFGTFVLSYRVVSLAAVATFVGAALLFGGITQLVVARRAPTLRRLSIVGGILGVAAGVVTLVWPGITLFVVSIMVAWYLIALGTIHIVNALAGPKLSWWWTSLLLGISELVLGVWAARSWERSLVTLVTLVGVWAICRGVNEIFAGFTLRQVGRQADRLVG
ncbi:HdeD family acid-resistance protein [Angustibacter sp. McL0619]|uniref:HdeD family acid-resistance protein n=1 Tax=Angustibacter sp. McL0619 TaxID=3415676 RepID=UPI003CF04A93